jgi:hypothetical protein
MSDGTGTRYALTPKSLDDPGYLVDLLGPEAAAELTPATFSVDAIDALAKHVASMSDHDMRRDFRASDDLIASLRELQASCGF